MVTNKKPTNHNTPAVRGGAADQLVADYRREQEHWTPSELLGELLEVATQLGVGDPRGRRSPATRAEIVVRELVASGNGGAVDKFLRGRLDARVFGMLRVIALGPEGRSRLDMIETFVDALAGTVRSSADPRVERACSCYDGWLERARGEGECDAAARLLEECGRFEGWPVESIRHVMRAVLHAAPENVFLRLAALAEEEGASFEQMRGEEVGAA